MKTLMLAAVVGVVAWWCGREYERADHQIEDAVRKVGHHMAPPTSSSDAATVGYVENYGRVYSFGGGDGAALSGVEDEPDWGVYETKTGRRLDPFGDSA